MNQKYFLAVMSLRNYANTINKRVKSVSALDETGLIYRAEFWDGDFLEFRIGMANAEIVYIAGLNVKLGEEKE